MATSGSQEDHHNYDHLIQSTDSQHPANLICTLCEKFYHLGWVAGTGGGTSIRDK
jgi:methylthioribulose-1-phosphate dehydratase